MFIYRFICLICFIFCAFATEGVTLSHQSFVASLMDYTHPKGIKAAIVDLCKAQLGADVHEEEIVDLKDLAMNGKSHDVVYFIYNAQHELIYVVKAFHEPMEPRAHFLRELSAMTFVQQGQFQHVRTAEPLAFGQCHEKGIHYALLVESVALGQRLMDYIEEVGRQPKGSSARTIAFEKFKQAMASAGRGFGELVKKSPLRKGESPRDIIQKIETRLDKYLQNPTSYLYQELLPFKELKEYIRSLIDRMEKTEHYFVYSHGDAHARNCLYDAETDIFTIIDLGRMADSIDAEGLPCGNEGYDFMRLQEDVHIKTVGILSSHEVEQVQQAFISQYEQVAGRLPSPVNQEFYRAYRLVARIEQYADHVITLDSHKRKERREIFLYAAKRLATMMKTGFYKDRQERLAAAG